MMVKDYFQDILPPSGSGSGKREPAKPPEDTEPFAHAEGAEETKPNVPPRSIRNISVTSRMPRRATESGMTPPSSPPPSRTSWRPSPRLWMWVAALVCLALVALVFLIAMRPTSVSVTPRSQIVAFDPSFPFRAYPVTSSPTSTLPYRVETTTLEDSEVVPATGTEQVEERARGTIIVVNEYSTQPVRLIENTRFETPDGLIYRIPSEIVVPGMVGNTPGELAVEVVADQPGTRYNIGPVERFTLPGLRSTPSMFADVYARSNASISGGFSGERPAVAAATLESARATVRTRLEEQARSAAQGFSSEQSLVIPDFVRITYTSLPHTEEAGGNVRIHEEARVEIPIFDAENFARTVTRGVSADAEAESVALKDTENLEVRIIDADGTLELGVDSFDFALSGSALLVWRVNAQELAEALAGKEEAAFEAIVAAFPGIEEARARVQPFWKNSFPEDPLDIQVRVMELGDSGS